MKWSARFETRPRRAALLVLVSSLTGLPPFFLMTLVAGAVKMNLALFLTAGTTGRLLRFGALVTLPQLVLSLMHSGS